MQAKFPWSIVLLLGGSFALAEGVKSSGLSDLIGAQLHLIDSLPLVLIQAVCILLAMCITSVSSNTVTASILIPIVNGLVRFKNLSAGNLKTFSVFVGSEHWG